MMRGLRVLMLALGGCAGPGYQACTQVGCGGRLMLTVVDAEGSPVSGLTGTLAVGLRSFAVDCAGTSDEGVSCDGGTVTVLLPMDIGGEDVVLDLHNAEMAAVATLSPDWTFEEPNGSICGPTCWTAAATVTATPPET